MRADPSGADRLGAGLLHEIDRLRTAIDREAASTDRLLNDHRSRPDDDPPRWGVGEHRELNRQLAALDESVARARSRGEDHLLLRAELATLLSFGKTLRADAEAWRLALADGLKELERAEVAAREQSARLAAQRVALVRRRDVLQSQIDQTAERIARVRGGECRPTLPVFRLGDDLSVCSVSVKNPRRGFRREKRWLVTLDDAGDGVVARRTEV
jgi:hypothetical protein